MSNLHQVLLGFGLTMLAGLSTGIGSTLAFFTRRTNTKMLSSALGFSAGVMIYVSFINILPEARQILADEFNAGVAYWYTILAFFGGIALVAIIDKFVPSFGNPHELHLIEEISNGISAKTLDPRLDRGNWRHRHRLGRSDCQRLYRMGILTAVAIAIHNLPEGLVTYMATIRGLNFGIPIATAIALHNIPEGIAIAVPVFYATGNRKKAFWYSFLSGLAEPLGAVVAFLLLFLLKSTAITGILFAAVAGIMVYISVDELLPAAKEYGEHHLAIYSLVAGMAVMALSLLLLSS